MAARPRLCGAVEPHGLLGAGTVPQADDAEREETLWPGFGSQYRAALLGLFRQRLQLEPRHLLLCLGQDAAPVAAALWRACSLLQPPVLWDEQPVQPPPCQRALLLHPPHDHHQNVVGLVREIFSGLEDLGEMLLVHRPGSMITLPFFEKARKKLAEEDYPYMKVLECLSELGADVQWEIEHVPVITSKEDTEPVTFEDRLMFIRASKTLLPKQFPRICRGILISTSPHASEQDVPLKLPLTEEISRLLEKSLERSNTRKKLL